MLPSTVFAVPGHLTLPTNFPTIEALYPVSSYFSSERVVPKRPPRRVRVPQ